MQAGKYRSVIEFQAKTFGLDEFGGNTEQWEHFCFGRARVRPKRAKEKTESNAQHTETLTTFYCRWMPDINDSMRIMHNGKPYKIISVFDDEDRQAELIIETETGVSKG